MSHLLRRYFLAFVLSIGSAGRWLDVVCSDYVFARTTSFTFADVRFARAHDYDLTENSDVLRMRAHQIRLAGRAAGQAFTDHNDHRSAS